MSDHGYNAYTHGCRCDVCRKAKADYSRKRRAAARAKAQQHTWSSTGGRATHATAWAVGSSRYIAPIEAHGTRFAYEEHGCRCLPCTDARTSADRRYRKSPGSSDIDQPASAS